MKAKAAADDDDESDGSQYIVLSKDQRAPPPEPEAEQHVYVHPKNWQAFQIFLACFTQWRLVAGMGGIAYQGLHYDSIWRVIKAHRCKHPHRVFRQVQYIETGALREINGRQDLSDNAADPG